MTTPNPKSEFKKKQFKEEFKKRIKQFILNLIQFIDSLYQDTICKIIADQLIRSGMNRMIHTSGTSIGTNYFEAGGGQF
jgi:hypothetical protein